MRNVSDKICTKNLNAQCMLNNVIFFLNRAIYELMWKNIVEPDRPQMTIWLMQITCWTPKATSTHSEYVIILALPLQLWSHESTAVLRYTFIVRLFIQFSALQCVSESCPTVFTTCWDLHYTASLHGRYSVIQTDSVQSEGSRDTSVEKQQHSVCQLYLC